jgi:hypothetical protein
MIRLASVSLLVTGCAANPVYLAQFEDCVERTSVPRHATLDAYTVRTAYCQRFARRVTDDLPGARQTPRPSP